MSKFSGKCDLYDEMFAINTDPEYRRKSVFIINGTAISNTCDRDLVPYYPFVCCAGAGNKDAWKGTYTDRPWYDIEDEQTLTWLMKDIKKYYKQCEKKHTQFDMDALFDRSPFSQNYVDQVKKLIRLVAQDGMKAKIPSIPGEIRLPSRDCFRNELKAEMLASGYTE